MLRIALLLVATIFLLPPAAGARAPQRPAVKAPARPRAPARPKSPPKAPEPAPADPAVAEPKAEPAPTEIKPEAGRPETKSEPPAPARAEGATLAPADDEPRAAGKPADGTAEKAAAAPDKPAGPDLARLRAEVADVREQVFRARARRETVGKALLSTQLLVRIEWAGGRRFVVKAAELRLDGVRLWEAGDGQLGDEPVALAPRSLAPGSHVLAVRAEVRPRDNPKLGYVTEQTFALDVTEGKKTRVEITVDEDGSPPSYNPDIEIDVDED